MDEGRPIIRALRAALPIAVLAGEQQVLVALSGGRDSMVLWRALQRMGVRALAWHGNHGWRETANGDAEWLQQQVSKHLLVERMADWLGNASGKLSGKEQKIPASINQEARGRHWRYERLQVMAARHQVACIVTAHHADDQAESVLANIRRGCGPSGLAGIALQHAALGRTPVIRPLLRCTRQQLAAAAQLWHVAWREDPTNEDTTYQRNWLRHEVLPALERGAPGISATLAARAWRRQVAGLRQPAAPTFWRCDGWHLSWQQLPTDRAQRWADWQRLAVTFDLAASRKLFQAWDDLASGPAGRRLHWGDLHFERRRGGMVWSPEVAVCCQQQLGRAPLEAGGTANWFGWRLQNMSSAQLFVTAPSPGDRWLRQGRQRSLKRDLADAGVPLAWRSVWPVIRHAAPEFLDEIILSPGLGHSAAGKLRLDCEWRGFRVYSTFAPPKLSGVDAAGAQQRKNYEFKCQANSCED